MEKQVEIGSLVLGDVTYDGVIARFSTYIANDATAIELWHEGEPLARATVNMDVPGVFIKSYGENTGLLEQLEAKGLVKATGASYRTGWVSIPEVLLLGAFAGAAGK